MSAGVVTLGGLGVGAALLIREFAPNAWGHLMRSKGKGGGEQADSAGGFNIRAHVPFLLGAALGMLAISVPGGFIGSMAGHILGISNSIGDKVLSSGAGGATTAATRHAAQTMDQYGSLIVVLLVFAVFVLRKTLAKPHRKAMRFGIWCGCTLGLSAGAAGLTASVLIPLAEQLGHALGSQV